jgi:hypothetical protein
MIPALIEKLSALQGPSREVDAEIMFDLFAKPVGQKDDGGPSGYLWPEDNPSWSFGIRFPGKDREWVANCRKRNDGETLVIDRDGAIVLMNALRIPELTNSLDAAIALTERVLPGSWWIIAKGKMTDAEPLYGAQMLFGADDVIGEGEGPTPAIALVLATLRALEAKEAGR